MITLSVLVLSLLIDAEAAVRRISLNKEHNWNDCVNWAEKSNEKISRDQGQPENRGFNDSSKNQVSEEEVPFGTSNYPTKVMYDYTNDSDLAMDDALFSYVEEKLPIAAFREEDYSNFLVLTRSGYEYESSPMMMKSILLNSKVNDNAKIQDTIDFKNISYIDIVRDFQPNEISKSIFLPDTRVKITDTKVFPYSSIGLVESGCTGTFVGPRHVLTAGHCVYDAIKKRWRKKLDVRRAKNCDPNQGVYHTWKYAIVNQGWRLLGIPAYDYAMIVVNEVSPYYMDFGYLSSMPQAMANINGYPGDKPGHCMWGSKCNIVWQSQLQLGHRCDTYYGMSGSAVYVRDDVTGRPVVYCVHAYGKGLVAKFNKCTRITETRSSLIKKWVENY